MIRVDVSGANAKADLKAAKEAREVLVSQSGAGKEYTGWLHLPEDYDKDEYIRIKKCAKNIYDNAEALVVIGIGGSYLGARAVIEFLLSQRYNETLRKGPKVYFLGNGINGEDVKQVLELVGGRNLYVNVISKSGTTLEPAVAFRIFKKYLEETYGKEDAKKRIICTTDKQKGALKSLADEEGYECFVVPDEVGGRYSVLTAVGLLPIAAAGIDIDELMGGARDEMKRCLFEEESPALLYAATRQALYKEGKKVEILSCPSESVRFIGEWWKQLFGESEGKDHSGIFPASCVFTADLHSMGQYIQDGERMLAETFISIDEAKEKLAVPQSEDNKDGLNYIAGKDYREIFACAEQGVKKAHMDGGVPCTVVSMEKQNAYELGSLIYFFEFACGVSAYMQGVNPFNQPGVEEYKKNMFTLLGKK